MQYTYIVKLFFQGDIVTKELVLGNLKVRNIIVNLGNKFIQSIKEDCGGNISLKLPAVKGDNVSTYIYLILNRFIISVILFKFLKL